MTLVDTENNQAMHSHIGPTEEAKNVYAAQVPKCVVDLAFSPKGLTLFDVGMGTAANVIELIHHLDDSLSRPLDLSKTYHLNVMSFETKPEGLRFALDHPGEFSFLSHYKRELESLLKNHVTEFRTSHGTIQWRLHSHCYFNAIDTKTAESEERRLPHPDLIFYDFYDPKVFPELWSLERFKALREFCDLNESHKPSTLITYSASTPVRVALLLSGFYVGKGAGTATKGETTIASTDVSAIEKLLAEEWLKKLNVSSQPLPYRSTAPSATQFNREKVIDAISQHPQFKRDQ